MSKKLYVDADGKAVGMGSAQAAFVFNEGDERLDKFRAARKAQAAINAGKPAAEAEDDGSVERVSKPSK